MRSKCWERHDIKTENCNQRIGHWSDIQPGAEWRGHCPGIWVLHCWVACLTNTKKSWYCVWNIRKWWLTWEISKSTRKGGKQSGNEKIWRTRRKTHGVSGPCGLGGHRALPRGVLKVWKWSQDSSNCFPGTVSQSVEEWPATWWGQQRRGRISGLS